MLLLHVNLSFFYSVASASMMESAVTFGVSVLASHSTWTSELMRELKDLQVMAESRPVVMLPGEKTAETRQTRVLLRDPLRKLADTLKIAACFKQSACWIVHLQVVYFF